jgi:hypothetical protein
VLSGCGVYKFFEKISHLFFRVALTYLAVKPAGQTDQLSTKPGSLQQSCSSEKPDDLILTANILYSEF